MKVNVDVIIAVHKEAGVVACAQDVNQLLKKIQDELEYPCGMILEDKMIFLDIQGNRHLMDIWWKTMEVEV